MYLEPLRDAFHWLGTPPHASVDDDVRCPLADHPPVDDGVAHVPLVVLCGSAVLSNVADANALARSTTPMMPILVTGGVGHSTVHLIRAMICSEFAQHREQWLPRFNSFFQHCIAPKLGEETREDAVVERLLAIGRSEAEWLADMLQHCFGFPEKLLWLECASTNCGDNAKATVDILCGAMRMGECPINDGKGGDKDVVVDVFDGFDRPVTAAASIVASQVGRYCQRQLLGASANRTNIQLFILQDPTMQRRSLLSFQLHCEMANARMRDTLWSLVSVATQASRWSPLACTQINSCNSVGCQNSDALAASCSNAFGYDVGRLISLVLGEHVRLGPGPDGYGPNGRGFIACCDMPDEVDNAFQLLKRHFEGLSTR